MFRVQRYTSDGSGRDMYVQCSVLPSITTPSRFRDSGRPSPDCWPSPMLAQQRRYRDHNDFSPMRTTTLGGSMSPEGGPTPSPPRRNNAGSNRLPGLSVSPSRSHSPRVGQLSASLLELSLSQSRGFGCPMESSSHRDLREGRTASCSPKRCPDYNPKLPSFARQSYARTYVQ